MVKREEVEGPRLVCCACGEVEVGIFCPLCESCLAAVHGIPQIEMVPEAGGGEG